MSKQGGRLRFLRGDGIAAFGVALATISVIATWTCPARANDTSYDPTGERMAWTDRFTTADVQPRIWLLTNGGGPLGPGRYLMTKATDVAINGWVGAGLTGLDTGLDAVSWPDGTTQRERVFYVMSSQIYMLTFDNEMFGSKTDCVSCALGLFGVTIQNTDVAAITFVDGVRRLAVAAGCTSQGLSGYLCICESDLSTWTCMGSSDRPLPSGNPSNHDIAGLVTSGSTASQEFYFQNAFAGLSRARRVSANNWVAHEEVSAPGLIGPSIAAIRSQNSFPGKITLGVIAGDNLVHTARIAPTDTAPTWSTRAALPNGATPFASKTALGAMACCGAGSDREQLFVMGSNLGLYYMSTTGTSGAWPSSWTGPKFSPSGYVASIGTILPAPAASSYQSRVFGAVGYPTYTLQEYSVSSGAFRDYIKGQTEPVGVGDSTLSVAETSSAVDDSLGIMTGIDRNYTGSPNHWRIRLRSSTDGGNTFDPTDTVLTTSGEFDVAFATDPTTSVAGGLLHFTSLEVDFDQQNCHFNANTVGTNITYRRGASASAISGALGTGNAFTLDVDSSVSPEGGLDHPWTVTTTEDAFGQPTAHVVYFSEKNTTRCGPVGVCYWRLAPGASCTTSSDCPSGQSCNTNNHRCDSISGPTVVSKFNPNPARAVRGANNEVYAFTDDMNGWDNICTLKNAFNGGVQDSDCSLMGGNQSPSPNGSPDGRNPYLVYVGAALSSWPSNDKRCDTIPPGGNGTKYKCFGTGALRAVVADPTTPDKVYVAYVVATSGTSSSIYFTQSAGNANCGSSCPFGAWSVPRNLTTGGGFNYDPQITVDSEGTIVVTYSRIYTVSEATSGAANFITLYSRDGVNWNTGVPAVAWNTSSIQYHCHRGNWFVGDYRDGKVFGNRAYMSYQSGGTLTTPYTYRGRWINQWSLTAF